MKMYTGIALTALSIGYAMVRLIAFDLSALHLCITGATLLVGLTLWGLGHTRSSIAYVTAQARAMVVDAEGTFAAAPLPTFDAPVEELLPPPVPTSFVDELAPERASERQTQLRPPPSPDPQVQRRMTPGAGGIRRPTPAYLRVVHDTGEPVDVHDFRDRDRRHSSGHT